MSDIGNFGNINTTKKPEGISAIEGVAKVVGKSFSEILEETKRQEKIDEEKAVKEAQELERQAKNIPTNLANTGSVRDFLKKRIEEDDLGSDNSSSDIAINAYKRNS
jgi:hypothetical protein